MTVGHQAPSVRRLLGDFCVPSVCAVPWEKTTRPPLPTSLRSPKDLNRGRPLNRRPKSWSVSKRATLQHRSANDSQAFTASTVPYRRRRALLARSKPPHCNSKLRILREKQTCLIFYSPNSRFSFACGSCRFRIGFHGNFNFGTFLQAHFITIFIRE